MVAEKLFSPYVRLFLNSNSNLKLAVESFSASETDKTMLTSNFRLALTTTWPKRTQDTYPHHTSFLVSLEGTCT